MIDLYDFVEEVVKIFEHCKTAEEVDRVEKRLHDMIESQGILVKEYIKAGIQ